MSNISKLSINLSPEEKRALLAHLLREKAKTFPLSYGQQAQWFLYKVTPQSWAYNTLFTARIRSDVDVPALRRAFQVLISRHPSLRTTYTERDGKPLQHIYEAQDVYFEEMDASSWNWEELKEHVAEEARRPFDLEQGPVMRVSLFTRSPKDYILLLAIHHIANDLWSELVLLDELRVLYQSEKAGIQARLPQNTLSYADYVDWQNEMFAGPVGEQLWAYWQQQLAGDLPLLNLPTDHPRPPVQTFRGASHSFRLSEELTQNLKELARTEGATLYMTLLAAFQVLLYRYTGQEDILVGSPTFGRSRRELADIVGYFTNPIVLRANLSGNPTFEAFLHQVRRTVSGAIAHQDYPFSLLVERLQPPRDPSRSPLFQVMFAFQNPQRFEEVVELVVPGATGSQVYWGELALEPFEVAQQEGQFDLGLEMVQVRGSLFGVLKYSTDLFDAATIARMADHFETLLEGIVANPVMPLSMLPLLSPAERRRLLEDWNATQRDYPDLAFPALFEAQVARTPAATAVVCGEQTLSYAELNLRANQLAHYLHTCGVGPEVLVGIYVERSLDMLIALLGVLKAGGAYLPLDPSYPAQRLAFMLADAQVRVLLTQEPLIAHLPPHQTQVIRLDADGEVIAQEPDHNPKQTVCGEQLAYVIYTSGSTGKPKGVQVLHHGLVNFLTSMIQSPGLRQQDTLLAVTTLAFDIAGLELFLPLIVGARVVIVGRDVAADGVQLQAALSTAEATVIQATPATWRMLLDVGWPGNKQLTILCGGEALPRDLANLLLERVGAVWNMYGPTETTIWSAIEQVRPEPGPILIGRPIANTQIYLLDQHLQPMPIGVPGELFIGGDGLARGYLHRPELTTERFIPNPFDAEPGARLYRTGDLARYLPDGRIEFLGRIDQQVKIRGFRIELGEIEAALKRHPSVRDVVVMAHQDGPGEKRLVAYVVVRKTEAPSVSELRRSLKEVLPEYMVPSAFVVLDELPLTPNGKVNRRALPAPNQSRPELERTFVAPRSPLEQELAGIWSSLLKVERVGIYDSFFELGGYSLLVSCLMAQLRKCFQVELPLQNFFEHPSIAGMAQAIERIQRTGIAPAGSQARDLRSEVALDKTIVPPHAALPVITIPERIFLTGATGFLGAYLLAELLERTSAEVYCLVRAGSQEEGRQRIVDNLLRYGLWSDRLRKRIVPVLGDLSRPLLGLSADQFKHLARIIDLIYHNGALVNFTYPYAALKASNVLGTQETLRLANSVKVKPTHYISTIYVFPPEAYAGRIREDDRLNYSPSIRLGYTQSKWVAEKIIEIARARGLPVSIYRPGHISGHSRTGACQTNDFFWRMIKGCIQLGCTPNVDMLIDMTPVDYVSAAIVHLSLMPETAGNNFHLINPHPMPMSDLVQWIRSFGYDVTPIAYAEWRECLLRATSESAENAASALAALFVDHTTEEHVPSAQSQFDDHNVRVGIAESAIRCAPVDSTLLATYFSYFIERGFLKASR